MVFLNGLTDEDSDLTMHYYLYDLEKGINIMITQMFGITQIQEIKIRIYWLF